MLVTTALLALGIASSGPAIAQFQDRPSPSGASASDQDLGSSFDLPAVHELQAVRVEPEVHALVDALADPSYERREKAMAGLSDRGIPIEQLCAALQEPRLTPEQEYRLLMIVRQNLLTAPRGAVGIKVDQRWWPTHIIIEELIDGLPAAQVLKVGDRITHLQGHELKSWSDFRRTIQSKAPGDVVKMTVLRPLEGVVPAGPGPGDDAKYERKDVEIRLGSAELLVDAETGLPQRNGDLDRERLSAANEATRRYAPRAMTVKLDGTDDVVVRQPFDFEVESNAHVRAALREEDLVRRGLLVLTPERRAERVRQLEMFKRLASDPALSEDLRDMHRRLAERYAEIIRH